MKLSSFYILILIAAFNCQSYTQSSVSFFGIVSYNSNSMSELKDEQRELLSDIKNENIPVKVTESYPAYFGFKIGFLIPVREYSESVLSLGGLILHSSTGGRIHYEDYSGELRADQIIKATGIGGIINVDSKFNSAFALSFNVSVNYLFSSFSNNLFVRAGDQVQIEKPNFSSSSLSIEPQVIPSFRLWKLQLGISISYMIYFPSTLEYDSNSGAYLVNKNGDKIKIDWSGLRIGLFTGISI
jgi:hypothetical protein